MMLMTPRLGTVVRVQQGENSNATLTPTLHHHHSPTITPLHHRDSRLTLPPPFTELAAATSLPSSLHVRYIDDHRFEAFLTPAAGTLT